MRVLQFAWSGEADHPFLPENHPEHVLSYTGTHDNETTAGWFENLEPEVRERVVARCGEDDVVGEMVRLSHSSPGFLSMIPLQDVLGLDNEARYNSPGTTGEHNWTWRLREGQLTEDALTKLRGATEEHGRSRPG
jgi:4-alpha-glucanotransferase